MTEKITHKNITLQPQDNDRLANLCGTLDENLRQIESHMHVQISNRKHGHYTVDPFLDKSCNFRAIHVVAEMNAQHNYCCNCNLKLIPENMNAVLYSCFLWY